MKTQLKVWTLRANVSLQVVICRIQHGSSSHTAPYSYSLSSFWSRLRQRRTKPKIFSQTSEPSLCACTRPYCQTEDTGSTRTSCKTSKFLSLNFYWIISFFSCFLFVSFCSSCLFFPFLLSHKTLLDTTLSVHLTPDGRNGDKEEVMRMIWT